jgi:hypothetical protein
MMDYGTERCVSERMEGKRIGASRQLVNVITLEKEFNSHEIVDFLRNSGLDVDVERKQTSMYDGMVTLKVYMVEAAKTVPIK